MLLLPTILLAFSVGAYAQNMNSSSLIAALQAAGLTSLATAAQKANATDAGRQLLQALTNSTQNYTIFAPNNDAFNAPAATALSNDENMLAAVLSYHVLPGTFLNTSANNPVIDSGVAPNVTLGRTLLTAPALVHLEGEKGQVLAWSKNDSSTNATVFFLNQANATILQTTVVPPHLLICTISRVLIPPLALRPVLTADNLTDLVSLVETVRLRASNNTIADALESNDTRGYTLFAPTDSALSAAGPSLARLAGNETGMQTVLGNHYINGTSYYSPTLRAPSSLSFVSASGQPFTFTSNSSGLFVTTGSTDPNADGGNATMTAKIVKTDVLVDNGVVHVIDRVLLNMQRDDTSAGNAYASATSLAAQPTTETGPVGPAQTNSGGSGGSGGGSTNAAGRLGSDALAAGLGLGLGMPGVHGIGLGELGVGIAAGVLGWALLGWLVVG